MAAPPVGHGSGQLAADRVLHVKRFGLPLRRFAAGAAGPRLVPARTAVPTGEHESMPGLDDVAAWPQVPDDRGVSNAWSSCCSNRPRSASGSAAPTSSSRSGRFGPVTPRPRPPRPPRRPTGIPPSSVAEPSSTVRVVGRLMDLLLPRLATAWRSGEHPRHAPPPPGNAAPRSLPPSDQMSERVERDGGLHPLWQERLIPQEMACVAPDGRAGSSQERCDVRHSGHPWRTALGPPAH
jgi:hypothetical protein